MWRPQDTPLPFFMVFLPPVLRRHLAIRKPNGKRVKLQLPDQAMAAQLRSGAKVQASGRWVTLAGLPVEDDSGSEPTRFVATDLQDASTKTASPERE